MLEGLGLWTNYHRELYDPPAEAASEIKRDHFAPPPPALSRSQTLLNYIDEEGDTQAAVDDTDDNVCPGCLSEMSDGSRFARLAIVTS